MDIGISRPSDHAVVVIKQEVAVERIGPSLHGEQEPEQSGAVCKGRGGYPPASLVDSDVAMRPIDGARGHCAQHERRQRKVLERHQGWKREEIEGDILAIEGIAFAVGHLANELKRYVPVAGLSPG